jgi:hypothetical protein
MHPNSLSKARLVREAMRERAMEVYEAYMKLAADAQAAQAFEVAEKILRFLIEHNPADPDGTRLIDPSAAKPKELADGPKGPTIQIGIKFSGMDPNAQVKSLPEAVEAEVVSQEDSDKVDE